jgi:hypothetical protein
MTKFPPRTEFHCPRCESTYYGTSNVSDWPRAVGHCHGRDGSCNFTWQRAEDWRVFYIVEITKFETKDEFIIHNGRAN